MKKFKDFLAELHYVSNKDGLETKEFKPDSYKHNIKNKNWSPKDVKIMKKHVADPNAIMKKTVQDELDGIAKIEKLKARSKFKVVKKNGKS